MILQVDWLKDPEFNTWLVQDVEDCTRCRCHPCRSTFKDPNKSALRRHAESAAHKRAVAASTGTKLTKFFAPKVTSAATHATKVAPCELIVTSFFAEHDLSFRPADHFWEMMKHAAPDSDILKTASAKRTKMAYLTVHGIALDEAQRVASVCANLKFSIMLDESTDISVSQVMALVVIIYDKEAMETKDMLLDLVEPHGGTARGLFDSVISSLESAGIDKKSIIGLGTDNCATMMGGNAGFRRHLEEVVPDVFVMGCICHPLALCAGHAARCLPSWLEMLVKDIASYLSRSPKRQDTLTLLQGAVNAPCHKIPKVAMTRWLSRGAVLSRILKQWQPLQLLFGAEADTSEGKVDKAAEISKQMKQSGMKQMLLFVHFVVRKVDTLNVIFQSESFELHRLHRAISDGYRELLSLYVKPTVMSSVPLHQIDPADPGNCMPLERIELGGRCESLLLKEPLHDGEITLRLDALAFLKDLCGQIRKRVDLDATGILAQLRVLDAEVALLPAHDEQRPRTLAPLLARFKNLVRESDRDDINDE